MNNNRWLFVLLLLPLMSVQWMHQFNVLSILMHVLFCASLVLLLHAAQRQHKALRLALKSFWIGFYFVYLFLLLFEVILFDFTGRGFTNEVYFHIEWESLRIGFSEYPMQLLGFALLLFFYVYLINKLLNKTTQTNHWAIPLVALATLMVLVINSSMARFSAGYIDYVWEQPVALDEGLIDQYVQLGVIQNASITSKQALQASTQADSKNLILLYLESFNEGLLHLDQYPGLTPNLNRLSQQHQKLNHLSSSYVTIEGVISSQCGTMLPMTAGNNTFLNSGQLMSDMPCLGDVLQKAGYTQYYLGGAAMEFAGKGRFFEEHGYDHIWGSEYWYANGFKKPAGVWGLSDSQLFENALDTIKKAALNPPYNVTLLTLGTHLPGYTYEGCEPYSGSEEPFIDAIHCTDQLVGRFVKQLEQEQLLDDAVLMIVADHGVFPTAKMKELFGEVVDDRRLIGISSSQRPLSDQPMSTYDLAPTLLDLLNISHNASFLYGQTLLQAERNPQHFVTRYTDWLDGKLVSNSPGECSVGESLNWPLNQCQKNQLLSLTSQLLERYSKRERYEYLPCQLDVQIQPTTDEKNREYWSLLLNGEDHFEHFYHNGYLLKSLKIKDGVFIMLLDDEAAITQHLFLKHGEQTHDDLQAWINHTDKMMLVIKTDVTSPTNAQSPATMLAVEMYKDQQKLWSKQTHLSHMNAINLCSLP